MNSGKKSSLKTKYPESEPGEHEPTGEELREEDILMGYI